MGVSDLGNWFLSWMGITGSTVSGEHSAVLVGGEGACSGFSDDNTGEKAVDCEAYGALGIVVRPRTPEAVETSDGLTTLQAESIGCRSGDGMTPLAWRDLRLNRAFPAPKSGSVAMVGYAGGFIAIEDVMQKGESADLPSGGPNPNATQNSVITTYCPYGRPSGEKEGAPTKAHCVVLDPVEETVSIIQGDGSSVLLSPDGAIVRAADGVARIQIENGGKITIVGNVTVVGTVVAGVNPAKPGGAGVPVLCGAGIPSVSLMVATP